MNAEILKSSDEAIALANHMFAYAASDQRFCTSWTMYATTPTTHEQLIDDLLAKLIPEQEYRDYARDLPSIVLALITHHAKTASDVRSAKQFLTDALDDLFHCHMREVPPELMSAKELNKL